VISSSQRLLPDDTQQTQQTDIHAPVGFEPTISAGDRPQIYSYSLDRSATGSGTEGLLSKNINITIYRTLILPVVLYGFETWSLILRKERRLRVFENSVLRRIFGPKREEVRDAGEECIRGSLMICISYQILLG
jgi:hypothetical protein